MEETKAQNQTENKIENSETTETQKESIVKRGIKFVKENKMLILMGAFKCGEMYFGYYKMQKEHAFKVMHDLCKYKDPTTNVIWNLIRPLTNEENRMLSKALKNGADIGRLLKDLKVLA